MTNLLQMMAPNENTATTFAVLNYTWYSITEVLYFNYISTTCDQVYKPLKTKIECSRCTLQINSYLFNVSTLI